MPTTTPPFYGRPIECTDRDAPFVFDGVLYHESDLNLEEHYTDPRLHRDQLRAEQWDRIGQFYTAFPAGHTTASAALQRLNRFQASNRFYAANRELGRALKTEFVLQYMSEQKLRAKVRQGLLKVEQLHALARAVYYGQRGRISAREV